MKGELESTDEKSEGGDSLFERGVVFHECTHQLLDFLRPKHRYSESMWFEEALSDRGEPNPPNHPGVLRLNFAVATGHPGQFLAHFGDELPTGLSEYCEELRLLLEDA